MEGSGANSSTIVWLKCWVVRAIFLNAPKLQVSGRYQPQKFWVGPSRKPKLDFLNDTKVSHAVPKEFRDGSDGPKILQDYPYANADDSLSCPSVLGPTTASCEVHGYIIRP